MTVSATMAALVVPPTPALTPFAASLGGGEGPPPTPIIQPTATAQLPAYEGTPTPDEPRASSGNYLTHTVGNGETLGYIAQQYGTTLETLMELNNLGSSEFLQVGQVLRVPGGASLVGPSFKIIPDSELVYGPGARDFDVEAFVKRYNGVLLAYKETVEGQEISGPRIVQLIADRFSVNPRLLLAVLEYRSGWVTEPNAAVTDYPLGYARTAYEGLYKQLLWAADQLNWGYYGRAEGGVTGFVIGGDGGQTAVLFAKDLNDGTTGVQHWLGAHSTATYSQWLEEVGPTGFFASYSRLFGNPFAYTVDPLWPAELSLPALSLPWASGETWYFTGGPHGGWAPGSAWAALDFVPHHEQLGCYPSDAWVRAMAPGVVVRSDFGAVVVDQDGDGYAGTGWVITYMHLETRDRIAVGTAVETGDPLGHPSCEGGYSNGTHTHIARTYNGRWVSADGPYPFVMDGWTSHGQGQEYNGTLERDGVVKEACECRAEENAITKE